MVLKNSLLKGILVKKGSDRVSIRKNDQLSAFARVEIDLRALRPSHLLCRATFILDNTLSAYNVS